MKRTWKRLDRAMHDLALAVDELDCVDADMRPYVETLRGARELAYRAAAAASEAIGLVRELQQELGSSDPEEGFVPFTCPGCGEPTAWREERSDAHSAPCRAPSTTGCVF